MLKSSPDEKLEKDEGPAAKINETFKVMIPYAQQLTEKRKALMVKLGDYENRTKVADFLVVRQDNVAFQVWDLNPTASYGKQLKSYIRNARAIFVMAEDRHSLQEQYDQISNALHGDKKVRFYWLNMNLEVLDPQLHAYLESHEIKLFPYNDDLPQADFVKYLQEAYKNYRSDNKLEFVPSDNPALREKKIIDKLQELLNENAVDELNTLLFDHKKTCVKNKEKITAILLKNFESTKCSDHILDCFKTGTALHSIFSEPTGFVRGFLRNFSRGTGTTNFETSEYKRLSEAIRTKGTLEDIYRLDDTMYPNQPWNEAPQRVTQTM